MQHPQLPSASSTNAVISTANVPAAPTPNIGEYPKLSKPIEYDAGESYRSAAIRPAPIGQENTGMHDINHSTVAASIPYNYNYLSTVATTVATISSNYTQPTSHAYVPSSIPSVTTTQSQSQPNTNLNQQPNTYSSQTNAYYNTQLNQPNMYAPAGFINPIYNNLSTAVTSTGQTKPIYGNEKPTTNASSGSVPAIAGTVGAVGGGGSAFSTVGSYSYATNAPTSASIQSYNYGNQMMSGAQNVSTPQSTLPITSQSYLNYTQSDTSQPSSYINSTYSGAVQTPTTVTYYSQTPQTSIYQSANVSSMANLSLNQQPQSYASVSYTDYTIPNNQVNAYQIPTNTNQYSQQQVSQNNSHSSTTNVGHMQAPQQIGSATAYTNYMPGYSTPSGTLSATNNVQSTYPSSDAYNYYNAPYSMQNTPASNQYYGIESGNPSNQYAASMASSYSTTGYGVTPNAGYSATNQANVYNYGAVNPSGNNYLQQVPNVNPAPTHVPAQAPMPAQTSVANVITSTSMSSNAPSNVVSNPTNPSATPPKPKPQPTKSNKFDLLSDLDNIPIPAPTLQPIKSTDKPDPSEAKKPEEG